MDDALYLRLLFNMGPADVYKMLMAAAQELPGANHVPTCHDWKRALKAAANTLPLEENPNG